MNLKEKVGQVFMVGFQGTEVSKELRTLFQHYHPGGVVLFTRNLEDPAQAAHLINALQKLALRANLGANVASNATVTGTIGYITSNTRFVENDNSFLSITGSGEASFNPQEFNRGWFLIPAELFAEQSTQDVERFTGGLTSNWQTLPWLTTRATVGYDIVNRADVQFFPTGRVADFLDNLDGVRVVNRFQISQTSVDLGATARFALSPTINSKTSVGGQWFRDLSRGSFATGRGLPAGSSTITGAATTESAETQIESRTAGVLVEVVTAGLFVLLGLKFGREAALWPALALAVTLVAAAATDLEQRIIPNRLMAAGAVLALVLWTLADPSRLPENLISGAAAGGFLLVAALAYPAGMGMGDVKLAAVMGLFLGRSVGPALFVGFAAGALVGMGFVAARGAAARKQGVPFAPFLALGGIVGLLFGSGLIDWYTQVSGLSS